MLDGSAWASRGDRAFASVEYPQQRPLAEWERKRARRRAELEEKTARRQAEFTALLPAIAAQVAADVSAAVLAALRTTRVGHQEGLVHAPTTTSAPTTSVADNHDLATPTPSSCSTICLAGDTSADLAASAPTTCSTKLPSHAASVYAAALTPSSAELTSSTTTACVSEQCCFDPEPMVAILTPTSAPDLLECIDDLSLTSPSVGLSLWSSGGIGTAALLSVKVFTVHKLIGVLLPATEIKRPPWPPPWFVSFKDMIQVLLSDDLVLKMQLMLWAAKNPCPPPIPNMCTGNLHRSFGSTNWAVEEKKRHMLLSIPWPSLRCHWVVYHILLWKLPTSHPHEDPDGFAGSFVLHWTSFSDENQMHLLTAAETFCCHLFAIWETEDCLQYEHLQQWRPPDQLTSVACMGAFFLRFKDCWSDIHWAQLFVIEHWLIPWGPGNDSQGHNLMICFTITCELLYPVDDNLQADRYLCWYMRCVQVDTDGYRSCVSFLQPKPPWLLLAPTINASGFKSNLTIASALITSQLHPMRLVLLFVAFGNTTLEGPMEQWDPGIAIHIHTQYCQVSVHLTDYAFTTTTELAHSYTPRTMICYRAINISRQQIQLWTELLPPYRITCCNLLMLDMCAWVVLLPFPPSGSQLEIASSWEGFVENRDVLSRVLDVQLLRKLVSRNHQGGTFSDSFHSFASVVLLSEELQFSCDPGGQNSFGFFTQAKAIGGRNAAPLAYYRCHCLDHNYYFNIVQVDQDYHVDVSGDQVQFGCDYFPVRAVCYFNLVKVCLDYDTHRDLGEFMKHQVPWDLGGSTWHRLEVKPNFKEGGMLATKATLAWAEPWATGLGLKGGVNYKYTGSGYEEIGLELDGFGLHSFFFSFLLLCSLDVMARTCDFMPCTWNP